MSCLATGQDYDFDPRRVVLVSAIGHKPRLLVFDWSVVSALVVDWSSILRRTGVNWRGL